MGTESLAKFTGCKAVGCYSTVRVTEDVVIFESFLEMEGGVCLGVVRKSSRLNALGEVTLVGKGNSDEGELPT